MSTRIRKRRVGKGLSQQALARRIGVSRQTVNLIECGRQTPSVVVALEMAGVLSCRVEDLFDVESPKGLEAQLVPPLDSEGGRVLVGRIGGRWVAHGPPASDPGSSDGVIRDGRVRLFGPAAAARDNVLVAGCAPLLGTLAGRTASRYPAARMHWIHASSARALELLDRGQVHVAGIHFVDPASGVDNVSVVRDRFGAERMLIVNLISWRQGLVVARGNPLGLAPDDLARPGLLVAWREEGAAAHRLLADALREAGTASLPGPTVAGHAEVAQAVATGAADVGVAIEAVAVARGLDFIPMSSERFDLIVKSDMAHEADVGRVLDVVDSAPFKAEAGAFGGYETDLTGEAMEVGPTPVAG